MKKESVDMRCLKNNGAVTFTSENSQLKQLLTDCKEKKLEVRVERFPYFISVVLKKKPIKQKKKEAVVADFDFSPMIIISMTASATYYPL